MPSERWGTRLALLAGIFVITLAAAECAGIENLTTEGISEASAATDWSKLQRSLRLPNTTFPLRYYVHISSNIHLEDFAYSGNVSIDIEVRQPTNEIVLHAKHLSNFTITMNDLVTGEPVEDLTYSQDARCHFLIIHPVENYQAFEAGQRYRLQILFTAVLNKETFGIYWLTYNDTSNRTVYLAATQFEPTSARLAFPCYDEPAFKSNFSISITHGSNYMAISNMPVEHLQEHNNQLTTTTFQTTPPISTYLVAFVISDYEYITEEYRGVTQRIFTPPSTKDKGHKALKNAVRTIAKFEDYFGVNYPLAKLDHIALKKNYGSAMENWGLITYREDNLVEVNGESESAAADMHKQIKDIITQNHEMSHQWFGNLVSPEWWTYAWLNEGFATYFSYVITDLLYPEARVMEFFLTDTAERAYSYNYIKMRPMTNYVEKESEILSVFDIISYQRAACVIKMFHHAFNQKTFVRGISHFLNKFQYTVANELHLFDSLQTAVAEDATFSQQPWTQSIREIMLSWTHSESIPIVTITRNYDNNTLTIRQRSKDHYSQELWWIPLSFATPTDNDFQNTRVDYFMPPQPDVTLNLDELGLHLDAQDWLIANKQQTGFYHVLYDEQNLRLIAKQLQRNHTVIHSLNRAALFQDLMPLIENNEVQSVDVIFELMKYLEHELDVMPWNLVADIAEFFIKNLYGTSSHALCKQFVRQLIKPMFNRLFNPPLSVDNMTNSELLARTNVLEMACKADLQECLDYTHNITRAYIFENVRFHTYVDYYGICDSILCPGVKYLSDEEFNAILQRMSKSHDLIWYDDLIYSLRCTENDSHMRQYLNLLITENSTRSIMNDHESMMYLFYLFNSNVAARPVMWHFFERHFKTLCRSPSFVRTFNIIAEYVPQSHRSEFLRLRDAISNELKDSDRDTVIGADSPRIGRKVQVSTIFVEKFSEQIHNWLIHDQLPQTYAASLSARSSAPQLGRLFNAAGKIFRKLISVRL